MFVTNGTTTPKEQNNTSFQGCWYYQHGNIYFSFPRKSAFGACRLRKMHTFYPPTGKSSFRDGEEGDSSMTFCYFPTCDSHNSRKRRNCMFVLLYHTYMLELEPVTQVETL